MLVAFKVRAVLTEPLIGRQALKFSRCVNEEQHPFHSLSAAGGTDIWLFKGVLRMRRLKQKKRMAYEITSAVVKKVEELTKVGVDRVDFKSIDPEYDLSKEPTLLIVGKEPT
jgi:hypothetical protein